MTRRPEEVVAPFSIDLSTGEVHWSPPIYRLYGLCPDADQPAMATLLAAIIPEDRDRAREEFTAGIRDGGTFSIRYHLHGADGRRHEIHLTAVGSDNRVTRYISGFLIDVTAPMTAASTPPSRRPQPTVPPSNRPRAPSCWATPSPIGRPSPSLAITPTSTT